MIRKLGYELVTLGHVLKRERDQVFESIKQKVLINDKDVFGCDLLLLKFLVDHKDKEIYQKDIEKFFNLRAPSVTAKLVELEKRNLITRTNAKTDTRLKQVIVKRRGFDIDSKIKNEMEIFEHRVTSLITKEEKIQLINIIDKLKIGFE
jgi:DNA-binding MarR family transcriptional regulator